MSEPAIRWEQLGFAYRPGRWILRGCSCGLDRGEVLAILGPNGCGKSTLLHLLLGVIKPLEGSIEVRGRMAFVPQLFQVTFDYTVLDMVLMGRARHIPWFAQPSSADRRAALAALARFGLEDLAHTPFHELSG